MDFIHIITHLDQYLANWTQMIGPWMYLLIFCIIFAETGLIVTPFLPGDSLLFALGALCAIDNTGLELKYFSVLLPLAALIGDNVNYRIGYFIGPRIFQKDDNPLFSRKHLNRTQEFYLKYGAQAVIYARFMPIVRTFVPFVAGVGKMHFRKYLTFSFIGAILWTQIFLWAGFMFGNSPLIKRNFHLVIFAVIILSLVPLVVGWFRSVRSRSIA